MDTKTYEQFLDALHKIVNEDGPYKRKAEALKAHMAEQDEANLEELISWGIVGE